MQGLRARLDLAAGRYAAEEICDDQLARTSAKLRHQLDAAVKAALALRGPGAVALDGLVGPGPETSWLDLPVARKRAVMQALRLEEPGAGTRKLAAAPD